MTKPMRRALWVLLPSLVLVAAAHVTAELFPQHWGSPANIGGGLLLVLAYLGVVAGTLRFAFAWWEQQQNSD